jgi:hypothetical protein
MNLVVLSQDQLPTGSGSGPLGGVGILPEEFRANLTETSQDNIEFFHLKYRTSTLDLRVLKKYTKYDVPESIVLTPPDLTRYDHTMVLIGIYGDPNDPKIVIWLAGNYNYNDITFFIDYDQDRNFTNDEGPLKIRRGAEPVEILLTPEGEQQRLSLAIPKVKVVAKKDKERIQNRIVAGFQAGAGSGDLTYSYTSSGSSNEYYVNISEKSFGASVSYYGKRFIAGINGSFQNHYHYASYNLIDGLQTTNTNQDLHAPNKIQISLYGAYRLKLTEFVEIQPVFKYGIAQYLNPEYKKFKHTDEAYALGSSQFYEVGMRLEFTAGKKNVFFLEFANNRQKWEPDGLPGTEEVSFESKVKISKFNVGFSVPL